MKNVIIREAIAGEPSLVVHFYYKLFEKQFDFLPNTEQYFLHAMEEYFEAIDDSKLWVAIDDGEIKGSICIVKKSDKEAQLRLFGTAPSLQGTGICSNIIPLHCVTNLA